MKRVGVIIDGHLPKFGGVLKRQCGIRCLLFGMLPQSSVAEMRFQWIADEVNRTAGDVKYELYRPWRRYQAIVFLKSMNEECIQLAQDASRRGIPTVFDANVDYFTDPKGTFYYEGMAPNVGQIEAARTLAGQVDLVIADSSHIAACALPFSGRVEVITDNINPFLRDRIKGRWKGLHTPEGKLKILWSGEAVKLFDLLAAEEALVQMGDQLELILITNSRVALDKWAPGIRNRFESMMDSVNHRYVDFHSLESLMDLYGEGGLFFSPRFLDNSYNLGHTEWKITLPLAAGLPVACSPQPSYLEVARLKGLKGVHLCDAVEEWTSVFQHYLRQKEYSTKQRTEVQQKVYEEYGTERVAKRHLLLIRSLWGEGEEK